MESSLSLTSLVTPNSFLRNYKTMHSVTFLPFQKTTPHQSLLLTVPQLTTKVQNFYTPAYNQIHPCSFSEFAVDVLDFIDWHSRQHR